MSVLEILRSAGRGVSANPMRSALTMLGVLIGVASVIVLVAVGNGSAQTVASQLDSLGSTTLTVRASASSTASGSLDEAAVDALRSSEDADAVAAVAPVVTTSATATTTTAAASASTTVSVVGTTPEYFDTGAVEIAQGTGISAGDVATARSVVVLGSTVAEDLFEGLDPVGRTVTIGSTPFTVQGVLASSDSTGADDPGSSVIAPLSRVQRSFTGYGDYSTLLISATSADTVDAATTQITGVLADALGATDASDLPFTVVDASQLLSTREDTMSTLTALLAAVAAISLLVGGIGVTNIMLVTVTERTREIGIRKALGARRGSIVAQFLVEAVVLCGLGGAIGAGIALAVCTGEILGVDPVVVPSSVALSLGVSLVIGVVFGGYPALRAAAMQPVRALRFE